MDLLINVANTLYVVAYFTTNMLRLRVLTLVAAACLALYFGTRPEPLWTVVGWNMFFLLLNLGRLPACCLRDRGESFALDRRKGRHQDEAGRLPAVPTTVALVPISPGGKPFLAMAASFSIPGALPPPEVRNDGVRSPKRRHFP